MTSIGDRGDPGGSVDVETNQTCDRLRRLPEMNAHADADVLTRGPPMGLEVLLHLDHRRRTSVRRGEDREEAVPLGDDFTSVVGGEPRSNDPVVVREDLGVVNVSQATEKRGRTLDVGEEEGERLRGSKNSDSSDGERARICRRAWGYRAVYGEDLPAYNDRRCRDW